MSKKPTKDQADTANGGETAAGAQMDPAQMPLFTTLTQYVKDFSFENPNAPRSLVAQTEAPQISLNVNVGGQGLSENEVESTLVIEGKAEANGDLLFRFELTYCGVFRIQNFPQEQMHPLVMIECPRLLFPFGRQIIADAVRQGGFPPLFIDPVDFAALYRQRLTDMQNEQTGQPIS
ncbi:MAG: protein-export chaperone SecB [Bosea sp. (in: a-proteobacteria)]